MVPLHLCINVGSIFLDSCIVCIARTYCGRLCSTSVRSFERVWFRTVTLLCTMACSYNGLTVLVVQYKKYQRRHTYIAIFMQPRPHLSRLTRKTLYTTTSKSKTTLLYSLHLLRFSGRWSEPPTACRRLPWSGNPAAEEKSLSSGGCGLKRTHCHPSSGYNI
jgi:hypothetical protein